MRGSRLVILFAIFTLAGCSGRLAASAGDPPAPDREHDAGSTPAPRPDAGAPPSEPDAGHPVGELDAGHAQPPPPTGGRDEASVFFVGHSLINFDMPAMLEDVALSSGVRHGYGSHIGNGASLSWIWNNPDRGEGEDPYVALASGRYDVLVITEAIPLEDQVLYNDTAGYARRFYELALSGDPATQVYLYETWHSLDGPYDWRARIDADRALWEEIIDEVNAATSGPDMLLVPGGTALGRLVDRIEAGGVPGLASRRDLFADDIHLNDLGNYLIALVHYATIYRRSPVGLTASTTDRWGGPFDTPSPDVARVMQEVAWEVVSSDRRAGLR